MLKKIKNRISKRKISELKNSPGEIIRDAIISVGIKSVQESARIGWNAIPVFLIGFRGGVIRKMKFKKTFARLKISTHKLKLLKSSKKN